MVSDERKRLCHDIYAFSIHNIPVLAVLPIPRSFILIFLVFYFYVKKWRMLYKLPETILFSGYLIINFHAKLKLFKNETFFEKPSIIGIQSDLLFLFTKLNTSYIMLPLITWWWINRAEEMADVLNSICWDSSKKTDKQSYVWLQCTHLFQQPKYFAFVWWIYWPELSAH